MESISIRPAKREDYQGILAINREIYRGRDYLPELFHDMMSNENILCLVACSINVIVGFTSGLVIDDGQAVIHRCGRLHESFQKQGLYKRLMLTLRDEVRALHPNLVSERIVLDDRSVGIDSQSLMETETFRTKICTFKKTSSMELGHCEHDSMSSRVYDVTIEELEMLLSDKETVSRFFPKFLTCFWKPFRPSTSNVSQILRENTRLLSNVKISSPDDLRKITNLSFYTSYKCSVGIIYHIDIYGNDVSVTKLHLTEIVQRMPKDKDGQALFVNMYNYSSNPMDTIESFFIELSFERTKGISEIIIMDRDIQDMR